MIAYVIVSPAWTNVLPDCVIAVLVTVISGVSTLFIISVYTLVTGASNSVGFHVLYSLSSTKRSGIFVISSLEIVVSWILSVVVVVPVPPVVVVVVPVAPPVVPVPAVPWLPPAVVVSAVPVGSVAAGSVPSVACSSAFCVAGSPVCSCVSVVSCSSCVVPVDCSL